MRELLYKNMTSWDDKKRDIFVEETVMQNGVLAKTTRRCLYFIKDRVYVKDISDMKKIRGVKTTKDKFKRHFHVLKKHDSRSGKDKLMCKVAGTFYAMVNHYLYCIVFVHTFRITFSKARC